VAIVDFDATPGGWTLPPPQLGATVAQLLLDKLVGVAPFHIFDGRFLSYGGSPSDRPNQYRRYVRTRVARTSSI
jgi:hypothetical protein